MHKIFSEASVPSNPFILFDTWYREHLSYGNDIPESVFLGTSGADGKVSVRTVLLKRYDETGFVFFTNYNSRKSRQISSNNNTALLFYWQEKGRQVRIEGIAEKTSSPISDEYFNTRPRESQISSWASQQSSIIPDRNYLEKKFNYYKATFDGFPVPRPDHWGGYQIIPSFFEFWENGEHRLHDRIVYVKTDNFWQISRLAP